MSWAELRINKEIKKHDPKLFVKQDHRGVRSIFREAYQHHSYYFEGCSIKALIPAPHFIMALTHNWTFNGEPCEWGLEPIMRRLYEIDGWNDSSFVNSEMEKQNEKVDLASKRDMNNKLEAAAYDSYSTFKKTFADINTANMNKLDKRRKKGV